MRASSYCVSAYCDVDADDAFIFMADGLALGGWALGSFDTQVVDDLGTVRGRTLDTGAETYVRPVKHPDERIVIYEVAYGDDVTEMTPWIWAIVHPSARLGGRDGAIITMIAWRLEGMSDEVWTSVCRYHDVEILLIKGQVEARFRR
jgi:hypothetical protein